MSFRDRLGSKKEYLITGGLVLCVIALATVICPPLYSMNDDVMMKSILSGAYTGTPDGHAVYMKYPLTGIISLLYRMTGAISWFDLVMVGCFWLSLSAVICRGLQLSRKAYKGSRLLVLVAAVVCLSAALFLPHLLTQHYTLVAAMVGSSALFLVVTGGGSVWVVLLILCYCIRSQVFYMLLPFLGITVLWALASKKRKSLFIQLAAAAAGILVCMLWNGLMYQSQDWKLFMEYNDSRTQLLDYDGILPYEENIELFEEAGITREQHRIMEEYVLVLENGVTAKTMELAANLAADKRDSERTAAGYLIDCVKEYYYHIMYTDQPYNLIMIGGYLLVLALLLKKRAYLKLLLVCCLAGGRSLIWVFLIWRGRFPERIYVSLYFLDIMILTGMILELLCLQRARRADDLRIEPMPECSQPVGAVALSDSRAFKRFIPQVLGGLVSLLLLAAFINQFQIMYDRTVEQAMKQRKYEAMVQYCSQQPKTLYLLDVRSMVSYTGKVWQTAKEQENYLLAGGWISASPLVEARLLGAVDGGALLAAGAGDVTDCCYVIAPNRDIAWLQEYLSVRFRDVQLEKIDSVTLDGADIFYVYRPVRN